MRPTTSARATRPSGLRRFATIGPVTGWMSRKVIVRHLLLGLLVLGTLARHHLSAVGHAHGSDGTHRHPAAFWHTADAAPTDPDDAAQLHAAQAGAAHLDAEASACCAASALVGHQAAPAESHPGHGGDSDALWHLCLAVLGLAAALRLALSRRHSLATSLRPAVQLQWARRVAIDTFRRPLATALVSTVVLRL